MGWTAERWVLSFVAFWLAYKSKELAVMLPVVLLAYEVWFGKRRWKILAPFFLTSLSFGVQGMLGNPNKDNDYTFRFTWAALAKTSVFYAGRIFLMPYAGFVVPLLALLARNRRTWFGLAAMALFLFPVLFLPGRIFSAYCYLPFAGLAIALTGVAKRLARGARAIPGAVAAHGFPRIAHAAARDAGQRQRGARVDERRQRDSPPAKEKVDGFVFSGTPGGFHSWGVEGTLKYFYERSDLVVKPVGTKPVMRGAWR